MDEQQHRSGCLAWTGGMCGCGFDNRRVQQRIDRAVADTYKACAKIADEAEQTFLRGARDRDSSLVAQGCAYVRELLRARGKRAKT